MVLPLQITITARCAIFAKILRIKINKARFLQKFILDAYLLFMGCSRFSIFDTSKPTKHNFASPFIRHQYSASKIRLLSGSGLLKKLGYWGKSERFLE